MRPSCFSGWEVFHVRGGSVTTASPPGQQVPSLLNGQGIFEGLEGFLGSLVVCYGFRFPTYALCDACHRLRQIVCYRLHIFL